MEQTMFWSRASVFRLFHCGKVCLRQFHRRRWIAPFMQLAKQKVIRRSWACSLRMNAWGHSIQCMYFVLVQCMLNLRACGPMSSSCGRPTLSYLELGFDHAALLGHDSVNSPSDFWWCVLELKTISKVNIWRLGHLECHNLARRDT